MRATTCPGACTSGSRPRAVVDLGDGQPRSLPPIPGLLNAEHEGITAVRARHEPPIPFPRRPSGTSQVTVTSRVAWLTKTTRPAARDEQDRRRDRDQGPSHRA